ncbi:MAG: chemotaxis protein CheW [Cyanobacteria bacterium J06600_6]
MSNLLPQSNLSTINSKTANVDSLQYLRFRLDPDVRAILPIDQITEILKLQLIEVMPIPQMPTWVMGVYNWRGNILWMVDLGQLIGLDSWYQHHHHRSEHTAIVLSPYRQHKKSERQIHLGLMVAGVEDLENCQPEAIQAQTDSQSDSQLNRFLQGYWLQPSGAMILALNGLAIAQAMPTTKL